MLSEIFRALYLMTSKRDKPSPSDWVKHNQISYDRQAGVLRVQFKPGEDIKIFGVANTKSMDGFMDYNTNLIGTADFDKGKLRPGDDIIFRIYTDLIIHRIRKVMKDIAGRIYRTRGINNVYTDPYYIRDDNVEYVVVGQFN